MVTSLTRHQQEVLRAFYEFGRDMDDTALSTFVHHISDVPMSSSSVRSRRAELTRPDDNRGPLLQVTATKKLKSGRHAAVFGLTPEGQTLAFELFVPAVSAV